MATFYNQATLTYAGGTATSNVVTGELLEVLAINKNAVTDTYATGEDITYLVHLINAGATARSGLTVPAATYTQDAQTGEWTVMPGVTTLTVTGTV